jgi:hypothetical protein
MSGELAERVKAGRGHGSRDRDGYTRSHLCCVECSETVFKAAIGNLPGYRYALPMMVNAIKTHRCKPPE